MKMQRTDLDALQSAIERTVDTAGMRENYRREGLSDTRFRWDCLWASGFNITSLYAYLDDSHIDTALRHILG